MRVLCSSRPNDETKRGGCNTPAALCRRPHLLPLQRPTVGYTIHMNAIPSPYFARPETLASHFHVYEGDTVLDFGAGAGAFVPHLAKKVGQQGRVVACEIDRRLVESIGRLAHAHNLSHVDVHWCDLESPETVRLKDDFADAAVLINTLFQIVDRETAIAAMARTLRSGAVLYVVDWADSFRGIGPAEECVICKEAMIALFESAYFVLEREYPAGAYHYGLSFRKL